MFNKKPPYGKFMFFFLFGAIAGALVSLFYAPTTGKKFQKQVKEVMEDQYENVSKVVKKVVNA